MKVNVMTRIYINDLDKWLAQNDAFILDTVEGCLLDNFYVACKRGIAFIFEEYRTPNSSAYAAYFFRHGHTAGSDYERIAARWEALAAEYEELTA